MITIILYFSLLSFVFNVFYICGFVNLRLTICIFCHDRGIPENVFNPFPGQMPNAENVHPHMMGQTGGIEVSNNS